MYIFNPIHDQKKLDLNYVDTQGIAHSLEYSGTEIDYSLLKEINPNNENIPLDRFLHERTLARLWNIIACNEGHPLKGFALVNKPIAPTDIKNMIIDLHSLQSTQAGNIQQTLSEYKNLFFSHDEEKRLSQAVRLAGWPLYAYEAIAYQVPPENIIAAIKISRTPKDSKIVLVGEQALGTYSFPPPEQTFITQGAIEINENFNPHLKLFFGDGHKSREVLLDYTEEQAEAISTFEKAQEQMNLKTTNIYSGFGGKTF